MSMFALLRQRARKWIPLQEKRWLHAAGKVSTCLTIDIVKNLPNSKWSSLNFGVVLLLSTTIDGYPGILMISNPLINMLTSLASCLSTPDIRKVSELDGEPDKSTVGGSSDDDTRPIETEDMALSLVEILPLFSLCLLK